MKNRMKIWAIAVVMLALGVPAIAGNWANLSNFTKVTGMAVHGNDLWVTAKGGVLRYNLSTGNKQFISKVNGDLNSLQVEAVSVSKVTGDIWIGTYDNGIAKFNGTNWTKINLPANSGNLYTLKVAADDAVWIATTLHFYRYKNGTFTDYPLAGAPWDFEFMPNGKIFCGSNQPFIFDPATSSRLDFTNSIFAYGNSRVAVRDDHHFAFSTDHGEMCEFNDTVPTDTTAIAMAVKMQYDSLGHLYYLSDNGILYRKEAVFTALNTGTNFLTAFALLPAGEMWLGASDLEHCSLVHFNGSSPYAFIDLKKSELSDNWVYNVRGADAGTVLISNRTSIQRFDIALKQFTQEWKDSLPNTFNGAIEINGKLYLSTSAQYLYEWKNNKWVQLGNGILPNQEIRKMTADAAGNLWMCGYGYIAKYDGTTFTVYTSSYNYHMTQYMHDILVDETHDNVWFCSYDGIFKLHNNTISFYNDSTAGFQQYYDAVECISEDPQHNIWFGTVYGALIKYDGTNFSTSMLPSTAGNQFVSDILFSGATMYVADNLNGLWKYENGQWDSLNVRNSPVSSAFTTSLFQDAHGNIWISHLETGIDLYNVNGVTISAVQEIPMLEASVYPNPSGGKFKISMSAATAVVRIFDLQGREIFQDTISNQSIIDLSAETSGIYLAEVQSASGRSLMKLVIR
ncbi:MAG: T9SS type A sorting domain-containing protein [Chitinophagales bacterium]